MSAASVAGLWRYPVKSMQGEACADVEFGARGVAGDRAYALIDAQTGKVASAKNPRLWSSLLSFRARYLEPPGTNGHAASVEISLPSGERRRGDDRDLELDLGSTFGRAVRFSSVVPAEPVLEEYWPDLDDLAHRDEITQEAMPPQTFFDCASVHLLTTGTLAALQELYPDGNFDVGRFRPNVLLASDGGGFAEDAWIGKTIKLGDTVVLRVSGGAPRCVMTTLGQAGIPADLRVLRTAAQHHSAQVGIYADVLAGGTVKLGDGLEMVA